MLASVLTTALFFKVDGCVRVERDRDRLDAIVATLVYEAGRVQSVLATPVTSTAISTLRPSYHFSQAALWAPEFQSDDISVEVGLAVKMFIERAQAAQTSIDFYRDVYLTRAAGLHEEEVARAQQSCANATAAATLLIRKLEAGYPRAARVRELLRFDTKAFGPSWTAC